LGSFKSAASKAVKGEGIYITQVAYESDENGSIYSISVMKFYDSISLVSKVIVSVGAILTHRLGYMNII
jgi:hypothetical protein